MHGMKWIETRERVLPTSTSFSAVRRKFSNIKSPSHLEPQPPSLINNNDLQPWLSILFAHAFPFLCILLLPFQVIAHPSILLLLLLSHTLHLHTIIIYLIHFILLLPWTYLALLSPIHSLLSILSPSCSHSTQSYSFSAKCRSRCRAYLLAWIVSLERTATQRWPSGVLYWAQVMFSPESWSAVFWISREWLVLWRDILNTHSLQHIWVFRVGHASREIFVNHTELVSTFSFSSWLLARGGRRR